MARVRASETIIDTTLAAANAPVKRGRPFAKKQTVAAGAVSDYDAKRTLSFNTFDDFARFMAGYPDPRSVLCYVYRLTPVINLRQLGSKVANIEAIADLGNMTRAHIEQQHGGGRYQLRVTDVNRKENQQVADTFLDIDMALSEPILDLGSLVLDDPKNLGYIQTQIAAGNLVRDESGRVKLKTEASMQHVLEEVRRQGAASGAGNVGQVGPVQPDLMQQIVLEILRKGMSGGPAAAPDDSSKRLSDAFQIADRLHPKSPLDSTIVEALLARALNPPVAPVVVPAPPEDMLANYERMDALLSKLGVGRGVAAADTSGSVLSIIQGIVQAIPLGFQLFQSMRSAAAPVGAAAGLGPGQGMSGGGLAAAVSPVAPLGQVMSEERVNGDPMIRLLDPQFRARVEIVGRKALEVFARGVSGFDFAASLSVMETDGDALIEFFRKLGAQTVVDFISSQPELGAFFKGQANNIDPVLRERFRVWLDDFLSYDPAAAGLTEEDDEEDEPKVTTPD